MDFAPSAPSPPDGPPVLAIDGFDGPLDWLLEMVRTGRINLARLSIAALIDAFAGALDAALTRHGRLALGAWGEWLVMAASLTLLRSQLLLPADAPGARDARAEAEALRSLLLRRARIAEAADWLAGRPQLGQAVFARGTMHIPAAGPSSGVAAQPGTREGQGGDLATLFRACLAVLRLSEHGDAWQPTPLRLWSVAEATDRMQRLLASLPGATPMVAFLPALDAEDPDRGIRHRAAMASTLVAGLELARLGTVALEQDFVWHAITVAYRPANHADVGPHHDPGIFSQISSR